MLTEAFRACSLGPSRPSVRLGSPGRAGRAGFRARVREKPSSRASRASGASREKAREARNHPHTILRGSQMAQRRLGPAGGNCSMKARASRKNDGLDRASKHGCIC